MLKKGTQVEIICGKDKGKKGEIIELIKKLNLGDWVIDTIKKKDTKKRAIKTPPAVLIPIQKSTTFKPSLLYTSFNLSLFSI